MKALRQGFSLIEALVALTIAALVLGAIFELQIQMARGQQRAADAMVQVMAQENAIALLRDINPLLQPTGQISLADGDTITWTSTPVTDLRRNAGFPAGDGLFEVQLFTMTVDVRRAAGRAPLPMTFNRMGWRRIEVSTIN